MWRALDFILKNDFYENGRAAVESGSGMPQNNHKLLQKWVEILNLQNKVSLSES